MTNITDIKINDRPDSLAIFFNLNITILTSGIDQREKNNVTNPKLQSYFKSEF